MGESGFGESDDFPRRLVAHHVQVMLQRRVFGSLEVNQLHRLVDPNLRAARTLHQKSDKNTQSLLGKSFVLLI